MKWTDIVLNEFVLKYSRGVKWKKSELNTILRHLKSISFNNGGKIYYDIKLPKKMVQDYLLSTVHDALQKALNEYSLSIQLHKIGKFYTSTNKFKAPFKFLESSVFTDRIDINTASAEAMVPLDGIGKKLAKRIVEYRNENGPFKSISALTNVSGVGEKNIQKFWFAIWVSDPNERMRFLSPLILRFKEEPNLNNYFYLIKHTGGIFTNSLDAVNIKDDLPKESEYRQIIIDEFKKMDEYLCRNRFHGFDRSKFMRASKLKEMAKQRVITENCRKKVSKDIGGITVLDDTGYFYFLRKLIKLAKKKIYVVMFLMHLEAKSAVHDVLQDLISARKKGVDVKVILDKDPEGSRYQSRFINKQAFNFLVQKGIPVLPDADERKTHTKMVIVDDVHVLIGSHNWTIGSFFRYDDKSVYVFSKSLAKKANNYFDELWSQYKTADLIWD